MVKMKCLERKLLQKIDFEISLVLYNSIWETFLIFLPCSVKISYYTILYIYIYSL